MAQQALAQDHQHDLIEVHLSLVHRVVRHLIGIFNLCQEEYDEYYSAGLLGLVEAAGKYDPRKGSSFSGFAFFRIKGAVLDTIRKHSTISPHHYRRLQALGGIEKVREMFQNPILREEIPKSDKLAAALEYVMQGALVFRLTVNEFTVDQEAEFHENNTPETTLITKISHAQLRKIVASLPEVERRVIEGYYFQGRSFVEIAQDDPPLSKSWVSRVHHRALDNIRNAYLSLLLEENEQ
ncbi:MAG: sigma-70 family RNA polymerase sigma factor [Bdellovibrionales bacterium]|nr:sigma-70 family RNA polymerase sigma factor [Bdellovibrionales bacterium]